MRHPPRRTPGAPQWLRLDRYPDPRRTLLHAMTRHGADTYAERARTQFAIYCTAVLEVFVFSALPGSTACFLRRCSWLSLLPAYRTTR